jgi:putative flavoprotein involved in K+ transport
VRFADGTELEVDAVIWATGYRNDHSWINDGDELQHKRGATEIPGLYFLGLQWQYTRGSALLGWVKEDAEYIADRIAACEPEQPQVGAVTAHTGA